MTEDLLCPSHRFPGRTIFAIGAILVPLTGVVPLTRIVFEFVVLFQPPI